MGDRELPIVLVGTENVVGQYRHQSKIDCFLDNFVHGSPRNLGAKEIHQKAWSIVEKRQEKRIREEIGTVAEALESDQGVRELSDICRIAYEGRLQILLVAEDTELLGNFDPEREVLEISEAGEDLLDLAAYYGWTRGSRVYAVPQSKIPGGRVAAGIVHLT